MPREHAPLAAWPLGKSPGLLSAPSVTWDMYRDRACVWQALCASWCTYRLAGARLAPGHAHPCFSALGELGERGRRGQHSGHRCRQKLTTALGIHQPYVRTPARTLPSSMSFTLLNLLHAGGPALALTLQGACGHGRGAASTVSACTRDSLTTAPFRPVTALEELFRGVTLTSHRGDTVGVCVLLTVLTPSPLPPAGFGLVL